MVNQRVVGLRARDLRASLVFFGLAPGAQTLYVVSPYGSETELKIQVAFPVERPCCACGAVQSKAIKGIQHGGLTNSTACSGTAEDASEG